MSRYGEPWKYAFDSICDASGKWLIEHDINDPVAEPPDRVDLSQDQMKRIVACINFCRELPTEWLQQRTLTRRFEDSEELSCTFTPDQKGG